MKEGLLRMRAKLSAKFPDPLFFVVLFFFKSFTVFKVNFSLRHRRYQSARGRHTAAASLKAAEGTEWARPTSTLQFVHWGTRRLANATASNQTAKQTRPARPTTSCSPRTLTSLATRPRRARHFPLMSSHNFFGYFCWPCKTNLDLCHVGGSLL